MTYVADTKRHLVCIPYSVENLHEMASKLGIKRCWFHRDHYDIPKLRNAMLISTGLVKVVETREIVRIIKGAK